MKLFHDNTKTKKIPRQLFFLKQPWDARKDR